MGSYLLDTDAIIDYLMGIAGSVSLVDDLQARGDFLSVCDVVIAEVFAGLRPEHRDRANVLLTSCYFLETSVAAARQAGEWRYTYARRGIALSTTDVLIAATAHAHHATIVTGNAAHYPMGELSILPLPRAKP
jgi:predicted nucleic acid-binding protein